MSHPGGWLSGVLAVCNFQTASCPFIPPREMRVLR